MVGSMMLLKMLHCATKTSKTHKKRKKIRVRDQGPSQDRKLMKFKIKKEECDDICRICLKEGRLPIFSDNTSDLSESIFEIGGVEVCVDDPYPKFLCQSCYALLQGAVLFRKTALKSENLLKTSAEPKNTELITETDDLDGISSDDHVDDAPTTDEEKPVKCIKPLVCNRCEIKFNTFREYSEHLLSAEHENKRLTCNICKNTYAPQYYRRHMSLHKDETAHMCDICGKKFAVKSLFTRHRLTHFYDLPFQCALCPYRGRFTESLKMHMRTHTGEKPYQCEQCPSRFINKSNLNKHMLTHKGEHDFRCEVCGRGFYTKRELELHIKVDHTGIREHVCRTCGKAFGYRKQMMKHELRVHKREKLKSGRMPIYLKVETMKQQNTDVAMET